MISKEQQDELIELVKPVSQWLQDHTDPHHHIIIDCNSLLLTSGVFGTPIELITEGPSDGPFKGLKCVSSKDGCFSCVIHGKCENTPNNIQVECKSFTTANRVKRPCYWA